MAALTVPTPTPSPELDLFHAHDPLLGNSPVLIFYGASTTANTTFNGSRIQAHVFSVAGYRHFPRLTVAPTGPLYAAVNHLPAEFQGDEVSRGLAVSLLSYFCALSSETRAYFQNLTRSGRGHGARPAMFDAVHAGDLAAKMELIDEKLDVVRHLSSSLSPHWLSWLDLDITLPQGSISSATVYGPDQYSSMIEDDSCQTLRYGEFDNIVRNIGSPATLPTPKLKRAPSRPPAQSRDRVLSREAKIALRREMCEFVDTESSYGSKLDALINEIASVCRGASQQLDCLFPRSLDQIYDLSKRFYVDIQASLDSTEDEAIRDIEQVRDLDPTRLVDSTENPEDKTGALSFANVLLEWFPKFRDAYQDYLTASSNLGDKIVQVVDDALSPASSIISQIGEQKLRSALIEPVQRLPRYNLIIDNIIILLPIRHPSLSRFLKARDIIKDICSMDLNTSDQPSQTHNVLSSLVLNWTSQNSPQGRLVTAVDVLEVLPPFTVSNDCEHAILLLFTDVVLVLKKPADSAMTARGIMAELDRPTHTTKIRASLSAKSDKHLRVSAAIGTPDAFLTESHNGAVVHLMQSLWLSRSFWADTQSHNVSLSSYFLLGPYENKSSRLSQEFAFTKIESRFPEKLREGGHWSFRTCVDNTALSSAVSISEVDAAPDSNQSQSLAAIRVHLEKTSSSNHMNAAQLEWPAIVQGRFFCQEQQVQRIVTKVNNRNPMLLGDPGAGFFADFLAQGESPWLALLPLYSRVAVVNELGSRYRESPKLNAEILGSVLAKIPIQKRLKENAPRSFRPISPVKMLSKILGGQGSHQPAVSEEREPPMSGKKTLTLPLATRALVRSDEYEHSAVDHHEHKNTTLSIREPETKTPLDLLEDTFVAYTIAIRSQSGNTMGRLLRNRFHVDELAVNEIYNALVEDPTRVEMAAATPIDVVFAAFEKFLRRGWREVSLKRLRSLDACGVSMADLILSRVWVR